MKIRVAPERIGRLAAGLIRVIGWTLRFEIEDRVGLLEGRVKRPVKPVIWAFWHNRMFVVPLMWRRYFAHDRAGAALTSASKDGAIVAEVMKAFGLGVVRGSSSRRGAAAVRELMGLLAADTDVAVVPDGPRGPCYEVGPGIVFLAQQTGAGILPLHVEYSRAVRLKSWDRFMVPWPFAKVRLVLGELIFVGGEEDGEEARKRLEGILRVGNE